MLTELWTLSDGQIIRVQSVGTKKVVAESMDSSGEALHIGVFASETKLRQFLFDTLRLTITHQGVMQA